MTQRERVGRRLRRLREERHLSLRALARQVGVNPGIVHGLESGSEDRRLTRYARRLAAVLGSEVLALAAPGQLALRLDVSTARERPDLADQARSFLREIAEDVTHAETIEPDRVGVWTLPRAVVITDRRLAALPA